MFARKGVFPSIARASAVATIVAVAITAVEPSMAFAGSAPSKGVTATTGTSGATDFSARRYYRGGGAAAAAAFAGIVGTGIAIAATQNRYYDSYGYYDAPRPITAALRPTTAAARIMAAVTTGRACPVIAGIPWQAGNRQVGSRQPVMAIFHEKGIHRLTSRWFFWL